MGFTSFRARLLRTFGYGKPKTVIPKTRGQAYYRSYAGGTDANLVDAIERRQPVSFFYTDKWQPAGTPGASGLRVGNPHALWIGKNGTKYLHLYVDPQSATATGSLPGWRTFIVGRISDVSVFELGAKLFGKPVMFIRAPGFNPGWYARNGQPIKTIQ